MILEGCKGTLHLTLIRRVVVRTFRVRAACLRQIRHYFQTAELFGNCCRYLLEGFAWDRNKLVTPEYPRYYPTLSVLLRRDGFEMKLWLVFAFIIVTVRRP